MAGKPSYLDEDTQKRIVDALRAGCPITDACAHGGIKERTYHVWRKRGEEYDAHLEAGGEIIDGEDIYRLFALEVTAARASARVRAVVTISKAAQEGDWKAAAWYLERTDPAAWGRINRFEMTGANGGPVELADVTEDDKRLAEKLRNAIGAAPTAAAIEGPRDVIDVEAIERPAAPVTARRDDDDGEEYAWGAGLGIDWPE